MGLIHELYDDESAKKIKLIYSEDLDSRMELLESFGRRIIEKQEKFLLSNPMDILCLICMTATFAESKEECQQVGIILHKRLNMKNPIPYFFEDHGFLFAEKTLIALSLFPKALEKRWKYHGAPKPNWYRDVSKLLFRKYEMDSIANNHEKWEAFLSEMFL